MFLEIILIIYTTLLILINLGQLYLFKILPSLKSYDEIKEEPLVSIIIPVKDEGKKIKECLESVLNQDYRNKEIIVVEGGSRDNTRDILENFKDKIRIVEEPPLPKGWVGKNWACYIGYKESKGKYLLFTDGDTIHDRKLLSNAIAKMEKEGIDFLTLIPSLEMRNVLVKMILPVVGQFIYVVNLAPYFNTDNKIGIFGNGQFMLFRRNAYEKIGGHEAVKNKLIEDFALASLMKDNGFRTRLYNGLALFKVRMYDTIKEMIDGWGKNFFLGLRAKVSYLILAIFALIFIYLFPFFMLMYDMHALISGSLAIFFPFSLIINLFYLFRFGIMYYKLNVNPIYALLYFIPIAFIIYLLIYSYYRFKKGIIWKGRVYKADELM